MTIYEHPPASTDTIAVAGPPIDKQLKWTAVQAMVDNPTTWWLYLPSARRFIAPGIMGAVVPLPGSTGVRAQWQAPVGYTQPTPTAGQQATIVWLSPGIEASPHPGIATVVPSPQTTMLSNPATGSTNGNFVVPAGTQSLSASVVPAVGASTVFLRLVGHTSKLLLGLIVSGGGNQPARDVFGIDSALDSQVDWTLTVLGGQTAAYINALPTPPPPDPKPLTIFPLHVNGPVTAATPYVMWTLSHDPVNPLALAIYSWSLSFDGAATANCFGSLQATNAAIFSAPTSNGPELWNRQLVSSGGVALADVTSEEDYGDRRPLIVAATDPTTLDMSLEWVAPVAATSYNVRGVMSLGVIPWVPGLGQGIA